MKLSWRASTCCLLLLSSLLAATPAAADGRKRGGTGGQAAAGEESSAPPGYEPAITNALREFELENYAEARSGFREAHRLYPNARTFRALGMTEFELKNYPAALDYLEQALASQERTLSASQRTESEQLLARARSYVGRFRVSMRPTNASLTVDGVAPALKADGVLVLPVGQHSIDIEADKHRPQHRELQVVGGEEEALDILLLPVPVAVANSSHQPDSPMQAPTPVYKKWWLWTTVGVVVAAGVATGVVLGLRDKDSGGISGGNTNTVLTLPPAMSGARQ